MTIHKALVMTKHAIAFLGSEICLQNFGNAIKGRDVLLSHF